MLTQSWCRSASSARRAGQMSQQAKLPSVRTQRYRMPVGQHIIIVQCLIGFVLSSSLPLAVVLLIGAGLAQSLAMLTLTILLLRTSEARLHGRIMGVRMLAIYTLPLGLLALGALIPNIGYHASAMLLVVTGLLLTLTIAVKWRVDLIRPDALGNAV